MNKKLVCDYLLYTFLIMILSWGLCDVICLINHVTLDKILLLRIPYFIGGLSPTIGSYIACKKNNKVNNLKEWFKMIFVFNDKIFSYILVLLFVVLYFVIGCVVSGFDLGAPIFMALVLVPIMIIGGGNEEVGWRMILQPEFERKYGFFLSSLLVGVIWWVWHAPLFLVNGTEKAIEYLYFGIDCIALSYALSSIKKSSKGTFTCILFHCLINGLSGIFLFNPTLSSSLITLTSMILISCLINYFISKKKKFKV